MTRSNTILVYVGCFIAVAELAVIVFLKSYVPLRGFSEPYWFHPAKDQLIERQRDQQLQRLIRHAELNNWFAPAYEHHRRIEFHKAWDVSPGDVYLSFFFPDVTDVSVVYRGDPKSGRLFWRAISDESP